MEDTCYFLNPFKKHTHTLIRKLCVQSEPDGGRGFWSALSPVSQSGVRGPLQVFYKDSWDELKAPVVGLMKTNK